MRSPVEIIKGRIIDYDPRTKEITIKARYPDWALMIKRQYKDCEVKLLDGRKLSNQQRKTVYMLLKEISSFTGQGLDSTKETMKKKFMEEELMDFESEPFSLSDASMSLVCSFQNYLVNFILDYDIPCSFRLMDFVDDMEAYIYACLVHKKCCICGQHCDLHHVDRVGMGGDREEMIHEGMEALPLCRGHHSELHQIGDLEFYAVYHITKGVILDKHLCGIYKLKTYEEEE